MRTTATAAQLTPEVFEIFRRFINQRPGLEPRNYLSDWRDKEGRRAFNSENRSIQQDGRRARAALSLALAYPFTPENAQALIDATGAFSGRLQIIFELGKGFSLDYTTGQYWPTEYRKAAAVVLERYVEAIRPKTISGRIPASISELKDLASAAGSHFFDRGSMKFFRSRIVPIIYAGLGGVYFVTSEQFDDHSTRRYTVRRYDPATADIRMVGEFNESTREAAMTLARTSAKAAPVHA
jgi:hypothetical protein